MTQTSSEWAETWIPTAITIPSPQFKKLIIKTFMGWHPVKMVSLLVPAIEEALLLTYSKGEPEGDLGSLFGSYKTPLEYYNMDYKDLNNSDIGYQLKKWWNNFEPYVQKPFFPMNMNPRDVYILLNISPFTDKPLGFLSREINPQYCPECHDIVFIELSDAGAPDYNSSRIYTDTHGRSYHCPDCNGFEGLGSLFS
jgi:hypothetical protein